MVGGADEDGEEEEQTSILACSRIVEALQNEKGNNNQKKVTPCGTRTHNLRIRSPARDHCANGARFWLLRLITIYKQT